MSVPGGGRVADHPGERVARYYLHTDANRHNLRRSAGECSRRAREDAASTAARVRDLRRQRRRMP